MRVANDPEAQARRLERLRANFDDPDYRAAHAERLREVCQRPEVRAARVEHGKHIYATVLNRPDVRAKNQSPEVRARAGRANSNTKLAWCPPQKRADYLYLIKYKHVPAAEARKMIEAELGIFTPQEEGRRVIERITIDMQLKEARRKAQAY